MKDSEYLKILECECADAEDKFLGFAEKTLIGYLKKAPIRDGLHVLDNSDGKLLGDSGTMRTVYAKNDESSGSIGSEYEWRCDEISFDPNNPDAGVSFLCEGCEFDMEDFERSSVIEVVKRLEGME